MLMVPVLNEQPKRTENLREQALDDVQELMTGHGTSTSLPPSEEQIPQSNDRPLQPEHGSLDSSFPPAPEASTGEGFQGESDQQPDDPVSQLEKVNESLKGRLADQQKEIDALRKMLQVSADVIQMIPAGLFLFQYQPPGELFFLNCNPEASRLTGLGQDDCRGTELDEIWPNARGQSLIDAFLEVARTGMPFEANKTLYRKGLIERIFRVKAFAIPGERLGVAFIDLSEQNRSEEAVRRLNEELSTRLDATTLELSHRNEYLESECSRLLQAREQALEACRLGAQEEMAGAVARMLTNPVENMQESAERALARLDSGYISLMRSSLEQIIRSARQVGSLTKQLRQFAGMAPPGAGSQYMTLDLNAVVNESVEALASHVDREGRKDVTPALQELILGADCFVTGEPSEMRDAVDALLVHAMDMPLAQGRVTVTTFAKEDRVVLEVGVDRGSLTEGDVSRFFEPSETDAFGWAKLGLAAAAGIVRRYGGEMAVVPQTDRGTLMTVSLPRVPSL